MSALATLTIHELAPAIERREVTPVEVVEHCLERIGKLDGLLNSFVRYWPDEALAAARDAEREIGAGRYRGPLHGVPVSVKDNLALAGWPTTVGSALMADHVTDYDAGAVERLRAAGAVVVGKNNLHEWARGANCVGGPFGTIRNPWDHERVPGGSSGGSAAAVSASLVYAAVGTDGKGSIRIPASFCGVVGLKPTFGLVSRFGQLPPTSMVFDHVGPITKDVTDAALCLQALAGHDRRDPMSREAAAEDYRAQLGRGVAGLRLGVPADHFFEQASPEVAALVRRAVDVLADLGAEVREVSIPALRHLHLVDAALVAEDSTVLREALALGPGAFADETIWERGVVAGLTRTQDTIRATRLCNLVRAQTAEVMQEVDLLAMPSTPDAAFRASEPDVRPGQSTRSQSPVTAMALLHNITGMPAVSLPCGLTAAGLPAGLMLGAGFLADAVLLRAAHAYEQAATGGYTTPPSIEAGG